MGGWFVAWVATVTGCMIAAGCGDTAVDAVIETPIGHGVMPARVIRVYGLDVGEGSFVYGQEIRLTFDRNPGRVELHYGGDVPLAFVAGEWTTRAFLLERSPTLLTWDDGGALELVYRHIEMPEPRVPVLVSVWPKFGARGVSFDNITTRTHVSLEFSTQSRRDQLIPRFHIDGARITGPDGVEWSPPLFVQGDKLWLMRHWKHPYERGQTYHVRVLVTFVVAPHEQQLYEYDFTIQR